MSGQYIWCVRACVRAYVVYLRDVRTRKKTYSTEKITRARAWAPALAPAPALALDPALALTPAVVRVVRT